MIGSTGQKREWYNTQQRSLAKIKLWTLNHKAKALIPSQIVRGHQDIKFWHVWLVKHPKHNNKLSKSIRLPGSLKIRDTLHAFTLHSSLPPCLVSVSLRLLRCFILLHLPCVICTDRLKSVLWCWQGAVQWPSNALKLKEAWFGNEKE